MIRKFLIKYHTDGELTFFLQQMAEQGQALKKVVGNNFYFENRAYDGRRVCALTLYRAGNEFSTELQVREELTRIRKKGWDCICVGKQETLKDSRRHVYLTEEVFRSPVPTADDCSEKRAQIRGKFKSLSNLLLCTIYLTALYFLFSTSLIKVVTNNLYIAFSAVFVLLLVLCSVLCLMAFANCFFIGRKNRILDTSTKILSCVLLLFAMFLACDSFFRNRGHSERIKIGTSVYHLYSDDIPVRLENLGANTSNVYRTTRYVSSESFAGEEVYCFDESFGIKEGDSVYDDSHISDVSFVSYTLFTSDYRLLRDAVASQIIPDGSVRKPDIELFLGTEYVFESQSGSFSICNGNRILMIRSGFNLSPEHLMIFRKALL